MHCYCSEYYIIDQVKIPSKKNQAYVDQFIKAIKVAQKEHEEYKANNDLTEIDVNYYRAYVRPLPFQ